MKRRTLLTWGLGGAALLAVAGTAVRSLRPGLAGGTLSASGAQVMRAVARGVLDGLLPADAAAQATALDAHLQRLARLLAALPAPTQDEVSQLLAVLDTAPGRIALAGVHSDWPQAGAAEIQQGLHAMSRATLDVRQQAFHALRELTFAAYFASPDVWALVDYPGPKAL